MRKAKKSRTSRRAVSRSGRKKRTRRRKRRVRAVCRTGIYFCSRTIARGQAGAHRNVRSRHMPRRPAFPRARKAAYAGSAVTPRR